jgi:hypothetical protein
MESTEIIVSEPVPQSELSVSQDTPQVKEELMNEMIIISDEDGKDEGNSPVQEDISQN